MAEVSEAGQTAVAKEVPVLVMNNVERCQRLRQRRRHVGDVEREIYSQNQNENNITIATTQHKDEKGLLLVQAQDRLT